MNNNETNETDKPCGPSCQAENLNLLLESLAKLAKDLKEERNAAREENVKLQEKNAKLRVIVARALDCLDTEEAKELRDEFIPLKNL